MLVEISLQPKDFSHDHPLAPRVILSLLAAEPDEFRLGFTSLDGVQWFDLAREGIGIDPPSSSDQGCGNGQPNVHGRQQLTGRRIDLPILIGGVEVGQPDQDDPCHGCAVPSFYVVDGVPYVADAQVQYEREKWQTKVMTRTGIDERRGNGPNWADDQ